MKWKALGVDVDLVEALKEEGILSSEEARWRWLNVRVRHEKLRFLSSAAGGVLGGFVILHYLSPVYMIPTALLLLVVLTWVFCELWWRRVQKLFASREFEEWLLIPGVSDAFLSRWLITSFCNSGTKAWECCLTFVGVMLIHVAFRSSEACAASFVGLLTYMVCFPIIGKRVQLQYLFFYFPKMPSWFYNVEHQPGAEQLDAWRHFAEVKFFGGSEDGVVKD